MVVIGVKGPKLSSSPIAIGTGIPPSLGLGFSTRTLDSNSESDSDTEEDWECGLEDDGEVRER